MATSAGLILMAASAWLITSASFHPNLSMLAVGITLVRAAGIFRAVFRYIDRYLTHTAVFAMLTKLRVYLYNSAVSKFPLKSGFTGEAEMLHTLTTGADSLKDCFPRVIQPILCAAIVTFFVTIFLFKTIGITSLILPFTLILILVISYIFIGKISVNNAYYREMLLDIHAGRDEIFTADSISIAADKLDNAANQFQQNFLQKQNQVTNVNSFCKMISMMTFVLILYNLIEVVDLIDLSVWTFILMMTFEGFNILPSAIQNFININKKIFSDMQITKNFVTDKSLNSSVQIINLNFSYDSVLKIIKNFNLEIKKSEQVAIIGESGCGKTTLLYLMLGLWTPDSGQIKINGTIAAATNNNYIFSHSIRENFKMLYPDIVQDKINESLKICQLENLDIDKYIGENASKLSGGERCRLQTALAIAADTDILILDEPTAGLDKKTAHKLIDEIIKYSTKKDRTLIIITHDLFIANMMNIIVKLST